MDILWFVLGLAALVVGAELLVRGSSRLALSVGISPLVVGLTVVAFGTSAPEVAVSVGAALRGSTEVAIGNVVGSNIFNVLFILGASAVIVPLTVHAQIVKQEAPIMIGVSVLLWWCAADGLLSLGEVCTFLGLLVLYTTFLVLQARRATASDQELADKAPTPVSTWDGHWSMQLLLIAAGLGLLVFGADRLVAAATTFARALGVSDLVIGLTIVAAGTSLPEVATSIMAAIRGQRDIAIGNVVGSNIFNIVGCLGATGLVAHGGLPVAQSVLDFDIPVMIAVAALCLPVFLSGREIARWEGAMFLVFYAAYTAWTVLVATQSESLPTLRLAMLWGALPASALALLASLRKKPGA